VQGVPPAKVDLIEANLREPTVTPLPGTTRAWKRSASSSGCPSARCARTSPTPLPTRRALDDFERTEELRICRWCNFKAVCRPELMA